MPKSKRRPKASSLKERQNDWLGRWPLERHGLAVLGLALFARENRFPSPAVDIQSFHCAINALSGWSWQCDYVEQLTAKSFRWSWYHFENHPAILAFVKDDLPDWAQPSDILTPISQRPVDDLIKTLTNVFFAETERLTGHKFAYAKQRIREEDFYRMIRYANEIEPRPTGLKRRYNDGLMDAVIEVEGELCMQEINGQKRNESAAIATVLKRYKCVPPNKWPHVSDPEFTIVATSDKAAVARIRERLYPQS